MHREFQTFRLNSEGISKAEMVATVFDDLLTELETIAGELATSREMSIVRTKLEEAAFFSKKAVASNPRNQLV